MEDFLAHVICGEVFYNDPNIHFEKKDGKFKLKDKSMDNINKYINESINKAFLNYSNFFGIPVEEVTMKHIKDSDRSIALWVNGSI